MIQTKSTKSNYHSSHTTPKESEEEPDEGIIDFQTPPIKEVDKLRTLQKEAKKTPPEEAKETQEDTTKPASTQEETQTTM